VRVSDPESVYEAVGGLAFFDELTRRFYARVAADPVLLAVYPEPEDLEPARRRLALFLSEYWGGPPVYSEERGHPRLRMRHFPFAIGPAERDHWLEHMTAAVGEMDPAPQVAEALTSYFGWAAEGLRNRD
jgi:hemoglobin